MSINLSTFPTFFSNDGRFVDIKTNIKMEAKVKIEVTKEDLFNRVVDVDVSDLISRGTGMDNISLGFKGTIEISLLDDTVVATGEFGSSDYESDFGFIIINNEKQ